jgi:hypothetical protein
MERDRIRDLASQGSLDHRARAAALLIVRYCSFTDLPYFEPWFVGLRDGLRSAVSFAEGIIRDGPRAGQARQALAGINELLDSVDPDGPPFESKAAGALWFGGEVCKALDALEPVDEFLRIYERADRLAKGQDEIARHGIEVRDGWSPPGLRDAESVAAAADLADEVGDQAIQRSRQFAQEYTEVIARFYAADNPAKAWARPADS